MNLSPNFSKTPGSWEQQLKRRWNNPLFPESSRTVVQHQVVEARERDREEQEQFKHQFQELVRKVSELPERAKTEQLLELIPKLDKCYTDCMVLGVPLPQERQALSRLIILFEQTLLKQGGDDSTFINQLQHEQASRKIHHKALENSVVAAMMRDQSPISINELPATLLSESPTMVEKVLEFLDLEQLKSLHQHAKEIIDQSEKDGTRVNENAMQVSELLARMVTTSSAGSPD